jgi:uncharacterized membrane protein YfcA
MNGFLLSALIAGLTCGFVDASLGMGYGVTSATVLVSLGIAPVIASASVHTSEMIVDSVSALSHHKLGNVEFKWLKSLLLSGVLGAIFGALFLVCVAGLGFAKPYIRVVLLFMGVTILYKHTLGWRKQENSKFRWKNKHLTFLGFFASFIDISGGGGWGPIITPTFIMTGSNPRKAVGTVEFTEPFVSLAGVLTFGALIGFETFLWNIVLPMIIGGVILTPFASWLTKKTPKRALGIAIGVWLAVLNVYGLATVFA